MNIKALLLNKFIISVKNKYLRNEINVNNEKDFLIKNTHYTYEILNNTKNTLKI